MNNMLNSKTVRGLALTLIAGLLIGAPAAPSDAATLTEDFESQTTGTDTLPSGWSLVTEAGSPTYANVTGSDGSGGGAGVGGRLSSTAFTGDTDLPGAYIVHSTTFDPTLPITGSFEVYIPQEAGFDDAVFIFGDIAGGLTRSAPDALNTKLYEGTGPTQY